MNGSIKSSKACCKEQGVSEYCSDCCLDHGTVGPRSLEQHHEETTEIENN